MSWDKVLALGWHLVDAGLHMTRPHKKIRMLWVGVGVGWSLYWLASTRMKRRFTTIKEWSIKDDRR